MTTVPADERRRHGDKGAQQRQMLWIAGLVAAFTVPSAMPGKVGWLSSLLPIAILLALVEYGNRKGTDLALKALLIATVIALFAGHLPMLTMTASMIPAGLIMAQAGSKKQTPVTSCTQVTLYLIGTWVIFWIFFNTIQQVDIYTALRESIDLGLVNALNAYSEMPGLPVDKLAQIDQTLQIMRGYIPTILPALIISGAIYTATINLVAANWLLNKKQGYSYWPPFSQWKLPDTLVWYGIGGGLFYLLLPEPAKTAGLNVLHIGGAIYFLEGLALLVFLLKKWNLPRLLKIIIFIVTVSQFYGFFLLAIAGLADTWADFRKISINNTTTPEND